MEKAIGVSILVFVLILVILGIFNASRIYGWMAFCVRWLRKQIRRGRDKFRGTGGDGNVGSTAQASGGSDETAAAAINSELSGERGPQLWMSGKYGSGDNTNGHSQRQTENQSDGNTNDAGENENDGGENENKNGEHKDNGSEDDNNGDDTGNSSSEDENNSEENENDNREDVTSQSVVGVGIRPQLD